MHTKIETLNSAVSEELRHNMVHKLKYPYNSEINTDIHFIYIPLLFFGFFFFAYLTKNAN